MLPVGLVLNDRYRVERILGRGGMATVYLVSHHKLPKQFALKLITSHYAADAAYVQRFRQEAELLARLDHPHIVQVIDSDQLADGQPYLVMELLNGEDLSSFLSRVGALTPSVALPIVTQIGEALQAAHELGIVHRDLKPGNIFLCRNGLIPNHVKVLDFGIAKSTRGSSPMNTGEAMVIGTPAYMSPEQARGGGSEVDARADQFALATITYELLSGQPAFCGPTDDVQTTLQRVLYEEPPPLPLRELDAVLRRALSKDRNARYDSVAEFLVALEPHYTVRSSLSSARTQRIAPQSLPPVPPREPASTPSASASMLSGRRGELVPAQRSASLRLVGSGLAVVALGATLSVYLTYRWRSPSLKPPPLAEAQPAPSALAAVSLPGVLPPLSTSALPAPAPDLAQVDAKVPDMTEGCDAAGAVDAAAVLDALAVRTSRQVPRLVMETPVVPAGSLREFEPAPARPAPDEPVPSLRRLRPRPPPPARGPSLKATPALADHEAYLISVVAEPRSARSAELQIWQCVHAHLRPLFKRLCGTPLQLSRTGKLSVTTAFDAIYEDRLNRCLAQLSEPIPDTAVVHISR